MTDHTKLRHLAERATPGPWWWGGNVDNHGDVGLRSLLPHVGVVDVLRTTPEEVDEESAGREWDTTDARDYIDRESYVEWRTQNPHRYLAFLREDDLFVEEGRGLAVFEVARNQGLPDDTPRDHPKVYRADVVAVRNANAEYIAAVSPDVVLALLDRIAELEGDEHHTMDELYEYRMLYTAHAAQGWLAAGIPVVKSWHHSDGELCFGGGWFIVVATLPTGQVSNHYRAEHWTLFDVPAVDLPPVYDGHTPVAAAARLREAVTP